MNFNQRYNSNCSDYYNESYSRNVSQRSSKNYCNFPQEWNWNNDWDEKEYWDFKDDCRDCRCNHGSNLKQDYRGYEKDFDKDFDPDYKKCEKHERGFDRNFEKYEKDFEDDKQYNRKEKSDRCEEDKNSKGQDHTSQRCCRRNCLCGLFKIFHC